MVYWTMLWAPSGRDVLHDPQPDWLWIATFIFYLGMVAIAYYQYSKRDNQ